MKSLTKNINCYQITIEKLSGEGTGNSKTLQFDIQDREDMFSIVDHLKKSSGLDNQSSTQLGVALRLLGPVMMGNRKHPLLIDFMPHFKNFMINLKKTLKNN